MLHGQGYTYRTPDAHTVLRAEPSRKALAGLTPQEREAARREHHDTWHEERSKGIGSSDASTLIGANRYGSLYALYADKVHGVRSSPTLQARMGHEMEPFVRQRWSEATGIPTRRTGLLANTEQPWMRCTPDFLTGDGGLLECKTTTENSAHLWGEDQPHDHAMAQVQWAMAVTGLAHAWIAVLFRDSGRFAYYRVERDGALIEILVEEASAFWHGNVLQACAPPIDSSEATKEAVEAATEPGRAETVVEGGEQAARIVRRLRRIKSQKKYLEDEERQANAELIALSGGASEVAAYGVVAASTKRNGTFRSKAYAEAHPDRAARYTTTVEKFDHRAALKHDPDARRFVPVTVRLKDYGKSTANLPQGFDFAGTVPEEADPGWLEQVRAAA